MGKKAMTVCVLCGREFEKRFAHDAHPLGLGYCCPNCNFSFVVPTRLNGGLPAHHEVTFDPITHECSKKVVAGIYPYC